MARELAVAEKPMQRTGISDEQPIGAEGEALLVAGRDDFMQQLA
jgi:hypothetical protein